MGFSFTVNWRVKLALRLHGIPVHQTPFAFGSKVGVWVRGPEEAVVVQENGRTYKIVKDTVLGSFLWDGKHAGMRLFWTTGWSEWKGELWRDEKVPLTLLQTTPGQGGLHPDAPGMIARPGPSGSE